MPCVNLRIARRIVGQFATQDRVGSILLSVRRMIARSSGEFQLNLGRPGTPSHDAYSCCSASSH